MAPLDSVQLFQIVECDERTARGEGRGQARILQERAWEPFQTQKGHERNCVLVRAYWLPHGE